MIILLFAMSSAHATPADLNEEVVKTVEWLEKERANRGYDLGSRYTEDLYYGDNRIRATGGGKTMCVAAVFEVLVRTLNGASTQTGVPASQLLEPKELVGSGALSMQPYVFQFRSNVMFNDYGRQFSAGIGDAFVLFGIGRYVSLPDAKPGDFVYFNRTSGGGHAVVLMGFLDATGARVDASSEPAGFRYFSAQKLGTNGLGFRDAFFGPCPKVKTTYRKDCGVIRSDSRALFAVSRLHAPDEWFSSYNAIRIQDHFMDKKSIDEIYAGESALRARAAKELEELKQTAAAYAKRGIFPMLAPKIATEATGDQLQLSRVSFFQEFGPSFEEETHAE